jgi:hypothetical protein
MVYKLHRLQLSTGQEARRAARSRSRRPTVPGSSAIAFNANVQFQRPALLEWTPPNGSGDPQIEIGFGSQCDYYGNVYHGWMLAYDAYTLGADCGAQRVARARLLRQLLRRHLDERQRPGRGRQRIRVHVRDRQRYVRRRHELRRERPRSLPPGLSSSGSGFQFFTPYTAYQDNAYDADTGSGGIMLLPDQSGPYPHEIVAQGKDGDLHAAQSRQHGRLRSRRSR